MEIYKNYNILQGGQIMEQKKLVRSQNNRKIAGVCGGVAEYLNLDPTIVRLIWAFLCIWALGIIAYIIAWVVIPEDL